ncbi:MAG: DeoR/GlpR family DNA-binding transcription regulator [Lachnospiraceae bacterium]
MDKSTRCLNIVSILQTEGVVNVGELAKKFQTSEMTIRRDLNFLASQYNIQRTHGGAAIINPNNPIVRTISFDEKRITHREEKEQIAEKAAELIKPRQRVFIDAGGTTRGIVKYIRSESKQIIVTNSLLLAQEALEKSNLSVIMLGGEMIPISNCASGAVTEEQIKRYQLDIAFICAAAIGTDGKLYDGYSPEARLKKSLFDLAKQVYLVADSSKFNTYDLNDFGSLNKLDGVITDKNITAEGLDLIKKHGVKVTIAD